MRQWNDEPHTSAIFGACHKVVNAPRIRGESVTNDLVYIITIIRH